MKIAIRADGGSNIGMGHIMRTLVLAKELRRYKNNEIFYICRIEEGYFEDMLQDNSSIKYSKYLRGIEKIIHENFKVRFVRENNLIQDLINIDADILITDSYDVSEEYFHVLKYSFSKTVYIDDMNLYYFDVNYLINQNLDAEDLNYRVNKDTKLILGTNYLMLRNEFKDIAAKGIKEKVLDIMITVGGADTDGITEKLVSYVKKLNYNFHIVIGPSFEKIDFTDKINSSNINFYHNANMCKIMQKCDMAISACGSTLYELAACGVPTLGIILADNQQGIAGKMEKMNIIKNLGWYHEINEDILMNNIDMLDNDYKLRQIMSCQGSNLFDGKGAERIAQILIGEN